MVPVRSLSTASILNAPGSTPPSWSRAPRSSASRTVTRGARATRREVSADPVGSSNLSLKLRITMRCIALNSTTKCAWPEHTPFYLTGEVDKCGLARFRRTRIRIFAISPIVLAGSASMSGRATRRRTAGRESRPWRSGSRSIRSIGRSSSGSPDRRNAPTRACRLSYLAALGCPRCWAAGPSRRRSAWSSAARGTTAAQFSGQAVGPMIWASDCFVRWITAKKSPALCWFVLLSSTVDSFLGPRH